MRIFLRESICFTYLTITVTLPPTIRGHNMIFNISLGSGNITSHETRTIKYRTQNISHPWLVSLLCSLALFMRVIISDHGGNLHSLHFTEDQVSSVAPDLGCGVGLDNLGMKSIFDLSFTFSLIVLRRKLKVNIYHGYHGYRNSVTLSMTFLIPRRQASCNFKILE